MFKRFQNATTGGKIKFHTVILGSLFVALTAFLQPMTRAKHAALTDALARRKAGETDIDESGFADLL